MKELQTCDKNMSFDECELAILRSSVDLAQNKIARRVVSSPKIKEMTIVVENFIKKKNLIPYGGIAINNILPKDEQFYDDEIDIPDYDFFSPNAMEDAKELADIYHKKGFQHVEAKAGQHFGTYKVFVDFIPVADITYLHKDLYKALKAHAIRINGILYTPPNFLRMSMFLELSRPAGDTSRWEKVFKRLRLLNKHYPLKSKGCNSINFQRPMELNTKKSELIFNVVKDVLINQGVVFFGGFAISQYSKYMSQTIKKKIKPRPDFDVLSNDPQTSAEIVKERLKDEGIDNVEVVHHKAIGEIIPENYEVRVGKDTISYIYMPIGCHSYNTIEINKQSVKIATIDTMLSFYLAFLYGYDEYVDVRERILCMAQFLFDVQEKNRLQQKGVLRRFSITCYGHQESKEEMKAERTEKILELKDKRGTKLYDEHFLMYRPGDSNNQKIKKNIHKKKTAKKVINKKYTKDRRTGSRKTRKRGKGIKRKTRAK
jgi:hypothetical protein